MFDLPPKVLEQPTCAQTVELYAIFGQALFKSQINEMDAKFLIEHPDLIGSHLQAALLVLTYGPQVFTALHLAVDSVNDAPLETLVESFGFMRSVPARPGPLSDPSVAPASEYQLAGFQCPIELRAVAAHLKNYGYRPATLRETLLVLNQHRDLLEQYPYIIACGSVWSSCNSPRYPAISLSSGILLELKEIPQNATLHEGKDYFFIVQLT